MPKRGKKYKDSVKEFDKAQQFEVEEAMDLVIKTAYLSEVIVTELNDEQVA